jgi:hypothetical protein
MGWRINLKTDKEFLKKHRDPVTGKTLLELATDNAAKKMGEDLLKLIDDMGPKSKAGNKKVYREGKVFDSKWEYDCWIQLKLLQAKGRIRNLKHHVTYKFEHEGVYLTRMVVDYEFELLQGKEWKLVVADAKSEYTAKFRRAGVAKRCMRAFYKLEVQTFILGVTDVYKTVQDLHKTYGK